MRKKIAILLFAVSLLISTDVALAANPLGNAMTKLRQSVGTEKTGLESDLGTSIGTIVKGLLSLVGTIFLVLTVYAGILWMTAQGNEEKVTKAKQIVEAAIIGLFIVMAAYAITAFVTNRVSNTSDTQTGVITCSGLNNGACTSASAGCDMLSQYSGATDCDAGGQICCYTP